jgi:hypothetical protein
MLLLLPGSQDAARATLVYPHLECIRCSRMVLLATSWRVPMVMGLDEAGAGGGSVRCVAHKHMHWDWAHAHLAHPLFMIDTAIVAIDCFQSTKLLLLNDQVPCGWAQCVWSDCSHMTECQHTTNVPSVFMFYHKLAMCVEHVLAASRAQQCERACAMREWAPS